MPSGRGGAAASHAGRTPSGGTGSLSGSAGAMSAHLSVRWTHGLLPRLGVLGLLAAALRRQRGDEGLLRDVDAADRLHPLLALLLLLEQLALAADVTAVALG